jgi:hypothetical protein
MAAPDLVESHDEDGFTPLHLAVIAGNMPLVTFLLANKADVNAVDNEKHTVVHWATGKCTYASYMLRVVHQIYEKLFSAVSCQRSIYIFWKKSPWLERVSQSLNAKRSHTSR